MVLQKWALSYTSFKLIHAKLFVDSFDKFNEYVG